MFGQDEVLKQEKNVKVTKFLIFLNEMIETFNPRDVRISYKTESNEERTLYLDGRDFKDEKKKTEILNKNSEFLSLFDESSINYSVGENEYEDDDGADEDGRPIIRRWHRMSLEVEKFYTEEEQIKMLQKQVQDYQRDMCNLNYVLRKRSEGYKLEINDNKVIVDGRTETFTNNEFVKAVDIVINLKRKVYKLSEYSFKPSVEYALEIIESDLENECDVASYDDFKEYLEGDYNITEEDDQEFVEEIYDYYLKFFKEIKENGYATINYNHFKRDASGIVRTTLNDLNSYIANEGNKLYAIKTIDTFDDFKEEITLSYAKNYIEKCYNGFHLNFNEEGFIDNVKSKNL